MKEVRISLETCSTQTKRTFIKGKIAVWTWKVRVDLKRNLRDSKGKRKIFSLYWIGFEGEGAVGTIVAKCSFIA